jgi:signal transduction histidine kinase
VEKNPVHVPELLRSCAEEISATAARKKIALNVSGAPDVGTIFADEGLLRRVLMNLMRNALKFTKADGRLDVWAECRDDRLLVKVQDTGIGIRPEQMGRLFGRFSRVQTVDGEAREGWGLGLYFCKLAVEGHGGIIEITSHPGQGTSVQFEIPIHPEGSRKPENPLPTDDGAVFSK